MFVKVLSSRDTKIGMLRADVVYELDEKDPKVSDVVKKLSSGKQPAIKKLSETQAKAEAKSVKSLLAESKPDVSNTDAEQQVLLIGDLTAALSDLQEKYKSLFAENKGLKTELTALKKAKTDAEQQVLLIRDLTAALSDLQEEHKSLIVENEALTVELTALKKAKEATKQ